MAVRYRDGGGEASFGRDRVGGKPSAEGVRTEQMDVQPGGARDGGDQAATAARRRMSPT
jgi:hypothetical protein